jgi:hypothetical protein
MNHSGEIDMNALIKCCEEKKEQRWCDPHEQTKSTGCISDLLSLQRSSDAMDSPCTNPHSPKDNLNWKMIEPELSNASRGIDTMSCEEDSDKGQDNAKECDV